MSGLSVSGNFVIAGVGTGWTVTHAADFDGDGRADILWRYMLGFTAAWLMDGSTVKSGATLFGTMTGWSASGVPGASRRLAIIRKSRLDLPKNMTPKKPQRADAEKFARDGYVILKGYFPNAAEFNGTIEAICRENAGNSVFMRHDKFLSLDDIGFTVETFARKSYSLRVPEIHALSADLLRLVKACRFEKALAGLLAEPAEKMSLLQSRYTPFSSNQASHSDKYLVSPQASDCRRETLLGVWLALDATNLENGAPYGWAGSHQVTPKPLFSDYACHGDYSRDLVATMINAGLHPAFHFAEPGDVVVWASDFVHGDASPLSENAPRRALVLHYGAVGES